MLEEARIRLVAADSALEKEVGEDNGVRDARDEVVVVARAGAVELREIIVGLFGKAVADAIFGGEVPKDPVQLQRFATEAAARMRAASWGTPRVKGAQLDPAEVATGLEQSSKQIGETVAAVADEVRETQVAREARNREMDAYDETFTAVATIFEGLFLLAGQRELADRVRPSRRRPGTTAKDANEPSDPPAL